MPAPIPPLRPLLSRSPFQSTNDVHRFLFQWHQARRTNQGPPCWCATCAIDVMSHDDTRCTVHTLSPPQTHPTVLIQCGGCGMGLFLLEAQLLEVLRAMPPGCFDPPFF